MGKAIAIFNQKGGVGKTTTNINLAACLAIKGKRVLILDIDPQGNTTSGVGISKKDLEITTHEILIEDKYHPEEAILPTGIENLDIMPASVQLAGAEVELIELAGREKRLKRAIDILKPKYDYIFIDCPPSLGILTINSLTAVDSVLIPIQCEFYALEGVSQLMSTIDIVKRNMNPELEIQGVILSMLDGRTNLSVQVVEEVKKYFREKVYTTVIPRNVRLAVALAVYSSYKGKALGSKTIALGEIGLTGDLRAVQNSEKIVKEAGKLGFERIVLPVKNAQRLRKAVSEINARRDESGADRLQLIGIKNISEIQKLF